MKILLTLDEQNYESDMPVIEKYSTRAVIIRNGRIATQHGADGDYKLLGGGMEPGEDSHDALVREVREESGLLVIPKSIREIGEIVERRRDIFEPDKVYECHSYFYFCDAEEKMVEPCMTQSEKEQGYHLVWASPEEIIAGNAAFEKERPWIYRDTRFVRMLPQLMGDTTLEVKNTEIEELMQRYAKEKTPENLGKLVEKIRTARLLVPANLNGKKQPVPCVVQGEGKDVFLAAYTDKTQIRKGPKSAVIINTPYLALNHMAMQPELKVNGIVINPFSHKFVFKMQLIERIEEIEKLRAGGGARTVQMTPEQYAQFERRQFEFAFLPKYFFEQGKRLIDALCEKREECIDELFEESYQQKRMYPYLSEEFSVMVMNLSEELTVIRLDMPGRDMGVPSCPRIYVSWDLTSEKGRYFTIEKTKDTGIYLLGEITGEGKHIDYGQAPVEGAELQRVIDLIHGEE